MTCMDSKDLAIGLDVNKIRHITGSLSTYMLQDERNLSPCPLSPSSHGDTYSMRTFRAWGRMLSPSGSRSPSD